TTGILDIALLPTLARRDNVEDITANYGFVIVDECHHVAASAFSGVLNRIAAHCGAPGGVHFSAIMPTLTNTEMIAGIGHARDFKNAEPEDVAQAVADVIAKPKPRVVVPRSMGVTVSAQRSVPQRGSEGVARFLGTGRVFTGDVDAEKRTSYARRTRTS
ncbi:MAG: hypothetical protein WBR28_11705, partial [Mycobacterium sp.]